MEGSRVRQGLAPLHVANYLPHERKWFKRLFRFLRALNVDVEVTVRKRPNRTGPGLLSARQVA